jgi:hypothetical protein
MLGRPERFAEEQRMSKRSAADKLVARISADIVRVRDIESYVGSDASEALTGRIGRDLDRLTGMRDYVSASVPSTAATDSAKPKRTRGKGKKAAAAVADGAVQS